MSGKKRIGSYRELSEVAKSILLDLRADFVTKGLSASALTQHYDGLSINELRLKHREGGEFSSVDFDLALKELEQGDFIRTGPMVPFDNPPGTTVLVIAFFSKREYARVEADTKRRPRGAMISHEVLAPTCISRAEIFTNLKSESESKSRRRKSSTSIMMPK